jgi:hypothetical protein
MSFLVEFGKNKIFGRIWNKLYFWINLEKTAFLEEFGINGNFERIWNKCYFWLNLEKMAFFKNLE